MSEHMQTHQKQSQQHQLDIYCPRKRIKYNIKHKYALIREEIQATEANRFQLIELKSKINNWFFKSILLLTVAAAIFCQSDALSTSNSLRTITTLQIRTLSVSTLLRTVRAIPSLAMSSAESIPSIIASLVSTRNLHQQQLTKQRQFQQQQLFELLTKNRGRETKGIDVNTAKITSDVNQQFIIFDNAHDVDEYGRYIDGRVSAAAATSFENTGFVADDGDRYEKAEKALAITGTFSTNRSSPNTIKNSYSCPIDCKCLNDFFDCGKKHLEHIPQMPNYVQILDMVGNKLNDTTSLQIQNLPELLNLSLKRNQLENVPKFIGLNSLKQLNLANNRIQRISSDALLALPKLKALDLSKNFLHTIELKYFPQNNRLAHLILNANNIANIDENAFEHLSNLLDLELNNNRLTALPNNVFRNLNKLKKLSLNNNGLEINWSTFKGLHALQKLFLKANSIRTLQDGVFHVMRAIETIELDHNHMDSLNRQGLFNLTKLHHLSISNNSISHIELDTWEFTQALISLDLSHNNISEFKAQHLDCLQRLRHLNLGHNKIQFLMDSTFDCVKNLENLNLRRNRLAWIIEDQSAPPPFRALRRLKKLDLYGNNLKQINTKSLSGLISLESLNLGGNALASVQSGSFEHMSHLQKLIFKSLNFICDCDLLWFRHWLQDLSNANGQQQHVNAVCGYPEHLLDRQLLSLTAADLICADTPRPSIVQEPTNQLTVKGANITLECIASSPAAASLAAADELKIMWRHDNQNVRASERPPTAFGHSSVVSKGYIIEETQIHHDHASNETSIMGYLRLYNVSYENAGKYQCVVSNAFGTIYSQKFKMSIGIHPTFRQIPSNLTIDSGDTARLVCSAIGDPMPEIALQKFGANDFPAATERRLQVIRSENAFIITNAKPIDTGIYTCTAESAAGEIKVNASLIVNDKPQPIIPMVSKEIVLGESSVLECLNDMATDLNHLHREWLKDNKPFHTSSTSASDRYYFTAEKELLVIVNTQSMDAGHYRCDITDNSKTYTIQSELIVVQADFSKKVVIIGVVLVTVACILIGSLIIWMILFYQKRKTYFSNVRHRSVSCGRIAASLHILNTGSRSSALDQTQLTTLNRTCLQQSLQQHQQRPYSLADLELNLLNGNTAERRNVLDTPEAIAAATAAEQISCLIVTRTPNYQQLLQRSTGGDERLTDGGFILDYLRRNSLQDGDDDRTQDHLSSKDSGTGSDAAVKRSLDDFATITMLPSSEATINSVSHCRQTSNDDDAVIDSYSVDGRHTFLNHNNKDNVEFVPTKAIEYLDDDLYAINKSDERESLNKSQASVCEEELADTSNRRKLNMHTNFNVNAPATHTVEI